MKNALSAAIVMILIVGGIVWYSAQTVYGEHIRTVEAEYQLCGEKLGDLKSTNQYMAYSNATLKAQVSPLVQALSRENANYELQSNLIDGYWQKQTSLAKTAAERANAFQQMDSQQDRLNAIRNQTYETQYNAHVLLLNEALKSRFTELALDDLSKRAALYGVDVERHGQFASGRFQGAADALELLATALPNQAPRPFWSFLRVNQTILMFLFGMVSGLLLAFLIAFFRSRRVQSDIIIASS